MSFNLQRHKSRFQMLKINFFVMLLELRQYKNVWILKKFSVGLPHFFNHRICHARARAKCKQKKIQRRGWSFSSRIAPEDRRFWGFVKIIPPVNKLSRNLHEISGVFCGSRLASKFDPAKRQQFQNNRVYFENLDVRVLS